jgi:hypothetical protein
MACRVLQGKKIPPRNNNQTQMPHTYILFLGASQREGGKRKARTARSSETGCNLQLRTREASALVGSEGHRRDDAPARWAAESHMPWSRAARRNAQSRSAASASAAAVEAPEGWWAKLLRPLTAAGLSSGLPGATLGASWQRSQSFGAADVPRLLTATAVR